MQKPISVLLNSNLQYKVANMLYRKKYLPNFIDEKKPICLQGSQFFSLALGVLIIPKGQEYSVYFERNYLTISKVKCNSVLTCISCSTFLQMFAC